MKDPKVFKLGINEWPNVFKPTSGMVLELKDQG